MGAPNSATRDWVMAWSGMRTPSVCFLGLSVIRGTSLVPLRMKVHGPGVSRLMSLKALLPTMASGPTWAKSAHTKVKLCLPSSWRMVRIRSSPSLLPGAQARAYPESVG